MKKAFSILSFAFEVMNICRSSIGLQWRCFAKLWMHMFAPIDEILLWTIVKLCKREWYANTSYCSSNFCSRKSYPHDFAIYFWHSNNIFLQNKRSSTTSTKITIWWTLVTFENSAPPTNLVLKWCFIAMSKIEILHIKLAFIERFWISANSDKSLNCQMI